MGFLDFISENEAVTLTGMSSTTLGRFAEAGYLQIESDSDGLRLYSREELEKLFGVKSSGRRSVSTPEAAPASLRAEANVDSSAPPMQETVSAHTTATVNSLAAEGKTQSSSSTPLQPADASAPNTRAYELLELENVRLKNLIELQEKILDIKDKELADLKGQRDWLQARIEKLDDKSDRDQVLILSETQTIRALLSMQQTKRSPVRLALEWLGFADPAPAQNIAPSKKNDIEVDRAA